MLKWFGHHGFPLPHRQANRFDFALDLTTGKLSADSGGKDCSEMDWGKLWEEEGLEFMRDRSAVSDADFSTPHVSTSYNDQKRRGFWGSCVLYTFQAMLQRTKHPVIIQDLLNSLVGGIILGIVTCGDELFLFPIPISQRQSCPPGSEVGCTRWQRFEIGPATFLVTMVLG